MRSFYPFLLAVALMGLPIASRAQQQNSAPQSSVPVTSGPVKLQTDQQKSAEPVPEEMPVTVKTNDSGKKKPTDTDPVMGVPPLPSGKTSMIGGRVANIDGVRNKLAVKIFGGGKWQVAFDERTHFYRDGKETTFANIKKGDRVYVDTMLDHHSIFARNVRVVTNLGGAHARGQVISMGNGFMSIRDDLSSRPVQFQVNGETQVKRDGKAGFMSDVREGSLIAVQFSAGKESRGVAREITVLAAPGKNVTFAGKVTHLDMRTGQFAVENRTDSRTYDIAIDRQRGLPSDLMVGSEVTVAAVFDGRQYKASTINVDQSGNFDQSAH